MLVTTFTFLLLFDFIPDFAKYETLAERKENFIEYVLPKMEAVNEDLLQQRERLESLHKTYQIEKNLYYRDKVWVLGTAERYGIKKPSIEDPELWNNLFLRVDYIPVSLIIAQAAIESGWGTSRFAQLGNNLFGHRCYIEGCGIVPKERKEGLIHEVETYSSIRKSIEAYVYNMNSNEAYKNFREVRNSFRESKTLSLDLAETLDNYSELGEEYAKIIKNVILHDNLQKFDR